MLGHFLTFVKETLFQSGTNSGRILLGQVLLYSKSVSRAFRSFCSHVEYSLKSFMPFLIKRFVGRGVLVGGVMRCFGDNRMTGDGLF